MEITDLEKQIRLRALEICRVKHIDYHDTLICVGPGSDRGFSPPCDDCLQEAKQEIEDRE